MKNKKLTLWIFIILILSVIVLAACAGSTNKTPEPTSAPSSGVVDGKTLLSERCTICHTLDRVSRLTGTQDEWQAIVNQMVNRGAVLSADEQKVLVAYLATTYGK
jgi:mono/diheme cytochrome c family protein